MSIIIQVFCLGTKTQTIKIEKESTVSDALKTAGIFIDEFTPFINRKEVNKNHILSNGDKIIITRISKGAVDVKHKGQRWHINLTDIDPRPSDFHAHSRESADVLNIYTGEITDKRINKVISKWRPKVLDNFLKKIVAQYGDSPITKKAKSLLSERE